jgi:branched-chain amino acid transport system substrate-binding protein
MKFTKLGVFAAAAMLVASACTGVATSPSPAGTTGATPGASATAAAATAPTDELGVVTIGPNDPLHIAFWGVLSGADVTLGTDSKYGVEIAIDDKGGKLLGHDILLTAEDGLCTPEGGATAAQKLAADKTIVGLVGSTCSDETVGGIKTLTDAGMTTISSSNTRPALTDPARGPEYAGYLRTAHSDAFQGKTVAEFVFNKLGLKTAATIHDGSAYAQALQQVFADNFKQLGGTITDQEAVGKEDPDMKPVLTKISTSNNGAAPDVLYYPIFIKAGGNITFQVRDVPGMDKVVLIGSDGMFSPDFLKAAGKNAEGMYLSSPDFTKFQGTYAAFLEKYHAKSGTNPLSIFHAHAYDAANILFTAIEKVAVQSADGTIYVGRKALRDAIYATKDFTGVTGTLTCSPTGDCGAPIIAVYQVTADAVADPAKNWPPKAPIYP